MSSMSLLQFQILLQNFEITMIFLEIIYYSVKHHGENQ